MSAIKIYNQTLSPEFCQKVITSFSLDPSVVKVNKDIIKLTYNCKSNPSWIETNNMFHACRAHFLNNYLVEFPDLQVQDPECDVFDLYRFSQVYDSNQINIFGEISLLWFLNKPDMGGSIKFKEGNSFQTIEPEVGRLIIFPKDLATIYHLGVSSASKYMVVSNIS